MINPFKKVAQKRLERKLGPPQDRDPEDFVADDDGEPRDTTVEPPADAQRVKEQTNGSQ